MRLIDHHLRFTRAVHATIMPALRAASFMSALFYLGTTPAMSQVSYPMLMSASPTAVQVGTESEVTLKSRYSMEGSFQVLVSGQGVSGQVIPPEPPKEPAKDAKKNTGEELKVRFSAAADAQLGVRDFRIVTPRGVSTVGQLVITPHPVIRESDDNNTRDKSQAIDLPAALCGRIEKVEDVDWFRFHISSPVTLTFHVLCMRLEDRIHDLQNHADPILTIRDSNGSVVVASDNAAAGDPLVSHRFEREGDYTIEMRDVRFQGNNYWEYCIEVSDRPQVTTVAPIAVTAGKPQSFERLGLNIPAEKNIEFTVPAESEAGLVNLPLPVVASSTQPQTLLVVNGETIAEATVENSSLEMAQTITVPSTVNGRIEAAGDVDLYRFEAKKGDRISVEVVARRAGSELDSHLRILNDKGNQAQLNDDMRFGKRTFSDSIIEDWTAPADGAFFIELRDVHLRGGAGFAYALQVTKSEPYFQLFTDTDKTPIAPGTSGALFVRAERKNGFDGEIQLSVTGLSAGVEAHCGRILAGKAQDGCIVFTAAADAAPTAAPIRIIGTAMLPQSEGPAKERKAVAHIYQEIYQPGGGRGHWPVEEHVVAVTAPADIRGVGVGTTDIHLKAGGSAAIEIELQRAEGFDKNVVLEVTYSHLGTIFGNSLPEGVTVDAAASTTLLTGGATKGKIVLKAADTVKPVEQQQFVIMANVSLNFVMKATYAGPPMTLTIDP
ncbi:MAG: PPC domain-containing protein [Pirellulales bacterium]